MLNRSVHLLVAVLVCIALLGVQAGNVHVHVCLDGQGPEASFHYGHDDVSESRLIGVGKVHNDYDIDLSTHSFAKLPKIDFTLVALLFPLALLLVAGRKPAFVRTASNHGRQSSPPHLRPPTCGPPLTSVV